MESTTQIFLRVQVTGAESSAVKGESAVGEYKDRVQINSFDFKTTRQEAAAPKRGDNQPLLSFETVKVSKFFDIASLRFDQLLKARTLLNEVRITVDQHLWDQDKTKTQNSIIVFHLLQARIVNLALDVSEAGAGSSLKETVEFSFRNFAVEYYFHQDDTNSDYRDAAAWFQTEYVTQPE
jgi:type VI protein secretion system component Hcp